MAYVYRHIKKTNNEIFYVGIGSDSNGYHKRAYTIHGRGRNRHWQNVVNKHGYCIDIAHDNITWDLACHIEKYLIAFYGRMDFGTGTLVNKTDGGEGIVGTVFTEDRCRRISEMAKLRPPRKHSEETKEKIRNGNLGRIISEEQRRKISASLIGNVPVNKGKQMSKEQYQKLIVASENFKIPVAKYSLAGTFLCKYKSVIEAAKINNCNQGNITNCCAGECNMYFGFMWKYIIDGVADTIPAYVPKIKNVLQFSLAGILLNEYSSCVDAARKIGNPESNKTIGKACRGVGSYEKQKFKGFIWKYKT